MVDLPEFNEDDVIWACEVLGLPSHAFSGAHGADPRQAILSNRMTLDVEACPGSGKTTLLVAKLAILARHWSARDQGLCVISHTNAARSEIEKKLGTTSEGQRLLSYPHYVGTIHGFVNEYLALPWLRSKGVKVKAINDDLCLEWRWRMIPNGSRFAIEQRRKGPNVARYGDADHTPKDFGFGENTATYQKVREACSASTQAGLFCHEEMFVWANELIEAHPEAVSSMRSRFPMLFIDEVQDNSEIQSKLLHRLFIYGNAPVIRQRFGDQNQAIYDYSGEEGAISDPFPDADVAKTIPNSHRFGQSIADLAAPLSISPQGLVGQGGQGPNGEEELVGQHILFLFGEADIGHVLPAYARQLRETFAPEELAAGDFTAVAAVHTKNDADHIPRSVRHYWAEYDPDISKRDPQPKKMVQFVRAAFRISDATGEFTKAVDTFASGILKLARLMNAEANITVRKFSHRYVIELLRGDQANINRYRDLVTKLVIDRHEPLQAEWEGEIATSFSELAIAMSEAAGATQEANEFLEWMEFEENDDGRSKSINVMHDKSQEPPVAVRLGSIHSVKGETHTATLVLESYNRTHHLKALKQWLLGTRIGGANENLAMRRRLKLHYVAMTRPRRLLCLAMREDSFTVQEIEAVKGQGWRVAKVTNHATIFQ